MRSFACSWSVDEADEIYERLSWALFGGTGGPRTRKKQKITNLNTLNSLKDINTIGLNVLY